MIINWNEGIFSLQAFVFKLKSGVTTVPKFPKRGDKKKCHECDWKYVCTKE
jgi:hypothetical protein